MNHQESPLYVVLGAGQIGTRIADLLVARGDRVRIVQRGAPARALAGASHLRGDITDLAFAEQATAGASVVFDCMNPAYDQWEASLLRIGRGALHGAAKAKAKLVALDCLYMYGRPSGAMTEASPMQPCSKKGVLRVDLANLRMGANARGDVRVAIGRASDFFGPNLPYSAWSERFFQRIYAGKSGECMGDPDMIHSYTYAEDVARALITLGDREEAMGHVWHLPTNAAESTRALGARLGRALGIEVKIARVPKLLLRGVGLFNPFMREVVEMTYQWEIPYVLDDSRFRRTFGQGPTPIDDAVRATANWARGRFARHAAA